MLRQIKTVLQKRPDSNGKDFYQARHLCILQKRFVKKSRRLKMKQIREELLVVLGCFVLFIVGAGCYTVTQITYQEIKNPQGEIIGNEQTIEGIKTGGGSEQGMLFDFKIIKESAEPPRQHHMKNGEELCAVPLDETDPTLQEYLSKHPPPEGYKVHGYKIGKLVPPAGLSEQSVCDTITLHEGDDFVVVDSIIGIFQGDTIYVTGYMSPDSSGLPVPDSLSFEYFVTGSSSLTDVPTLTEWGLIIFGVVLLGFITYVFLRRRKAVVSLR